MSKAEMIEIELRDVSFSDIGRRAVAVSEGVAIDGILTALRGSRYPGFGGKGIDAFYLEITSGTVTSKFERLPLDYRLRLEISASAHPVGVDTDEG